MEESIRADLKASYGLTCDEIIPVTGGWLNKKWKITAGKHHVLVKQFSNKRYSREKIELIEAAMQRQIILEKKGVPCPYIWKCGENAIRWLDNETSYMVMDFLPGKIESPATITLRQMHSLGSACGFMHKAFSQLPARSVNGFPINNREVIDSLWDNFHTRRKAILQAEADSPGDYQKAVLALEPILKQLTSEFFDKLPQGIAHEDFAPDNILFDAEGVSAILDFDRNHYSYLWHDIGRSILSFALMDKRLNMERISAFLEGYSQHLPLTLPDITDALRLSWCIEVPWWIQPEYFQNNREKVARFKDEVLWLTENWFELDSLLCS